MEGKYFTLDEYRTLIQGEQTDKDGNVVYLYANDKEEQYSYIEAAKAKGYSVLLMDGQLDTPTVSMFEQKLEKSRFTRVDGDIIERLIVKEDTPKNELDEKQTDNLSEAFRTQMPKLEKVEFNVEVQSLGEQAQPVLITQSEYMRRMKDMSRYQPGMSFYSQMPDTYQLVLNASHPLIKRVLDTVKDKEKDSIAEVAKENPVISQLIDLALLQNGMLKGASLDAFLKRSVELIK